VWLGACAALGLLWTLAASWQAEDGAARTAARGVLGGLAALGTASIAYGLLDAAGLPVRWEAIARGAWPALGVAALVGLVEEGAKLAGVVLAAPAHRRRSWGVVRITAAVAAVFAVAEAAIALPGVSWPVALGRAALGPVAHAALLAPLAVVLAEAPARAPGRLVGRLGLALLAVAALHGLGDWSIARPGWGRAGFAAALLAPTIWVYLRTRHAEVPARSPPRLTPARAGPG